MKNGPALMMKLDFGMRLPSQGLNHRSSTQAEPSLSAWRMVFAQSGPPWPFPPPPNDAADHAGEAPVDPQLAPAVKDKDVKIKGYEFAPRRHEIHKSLFRAQFGQVINGLFGQGLGLLGRAGAAAGIFRPRLECYQPDQYRQQKAENMVWSGLHDGFT